MNVIPKGPSLARTVPVKWLILLILWHGVIFTLSQIPELSLGFPALWDFVLRKLAHASEFGILAFLWYRVLSSRDRPCQGRSLLGWAGGLSLAWAVLDEYHQTFVFGRTGSPLDVVIDLCGILLSLVLIRNLLAGSAPGAATLGSRRIDSRRAEPPHPT